MARLLRLLLLILAAALWAQPAGAVPLCYKGVPLPDDLTLEAPVSAVPEAAARFAGIWSGTWDNGICIVLVVERVLPNGFAQVVFGRAVNFLIGVELPEASRRVGRIIDGELQLPRRRGGRWHFRIDDAGRLQFDDGKTQTGSGERVGRPDQVDCRSLGAAPGSAAGHPPGSLRDRITAEDLARPDYPDLGPVHNAYFMPVGPSGPAHHAFEGRLSLSPATLYAARAGCPGYGGRSEALELDFITVGDALVPVERGLIESARRGRFREVILSPGKVWSEPGDGGRSRASFPFIVIDRERGGALNGLATFLYDDTSVTSLRYQIVQETAGWRRADHWGQIPARYRPGGIVNAAEVEAGFRAELAGRLTLRPWSELVPLLGEARAAGFAGRWGQGHVSAAGLAVGEALYLQGCPTRWGPYPYCREMRHAAYSVTKSIGAGLALFRLAQTHGARVLGLKIKDFLEIDAGHDGWDEVTFADALNMAVGVGNGPPRDPLSSHEAESPPRFYGRVQSAQSKLAATFSFYGDYPWGPGEVLRYNDTHSFVLAAAMQAFLESVDGPGAELWDMVEAEVLKPIGVHHLPLRHTREGVEVSAVPWLYSGAYPTIEDTAKIALLLQNEGRHGGRQLLSASLVREALGRGAALGLPAGVTKPDGPLRYHLSFWVTPYRDRAGCRARVPMMSGYGGNQVVLMPNGATAIRFADSFNHEVLGLIEAGAALAPFCGGVERAPRRRPPGRRLSAAEVRETMVGNTSYRGEAHAYAAPDGTAYGVSPDEYTLGRWRIDGRGRFCTRFVAWREGAETCFAVFEVAGGFELRADDRLQVNPIRMRAGNPEGY